VSVAQEVRAAAERVGTRGSDCEAQLAPAQRCVGVARHGLRDGTVRVRGGR